MSEGLRADAADYYRLWQEAQRANEMLQAQVRDLTLSVWWCIRCGEPIGPSTQPGPGEVECSRHRRPISCR